MAVKKLSEITPAVTAPSPTDQFVGVQGGTNDVLFSLSQFNAITPASGNLTFYVATTGSDSNPGTLALPFRTIQHAVSIALSLGYQSLYQCTINVADGTYHETVVVGGGLLYGSHLDIHSSGFIIGNPTTPTNVIVSPNDGTGNAMFTVVGGNWAIDGCSVVADATAVSGNVLIDAIQQCYVFLGTIDFNTGTNLTYGAAIRCANNSRIIGGYGTGSGNLSFEGNGFPGNLVAMVFMDRFSEVSMANVAAWVFNSAINLSGSPFFFARHSQMYFNSAPTFTNPGNVTGGTPVSITWNGNGVFGFDPFTITWPGGAFDPSQIETADPIDGWFYSAQLSAVPSPSNTYEDAWQIQKDPSTGRRYLTVNDGGSIHWLQIGRFVNTQTGATYTFALPDRDGRLEMNNAGANTVTIDTNANVPFSLGDELRVTQIGAGATTIAGAGGVTVHNAGVVGGQWKSVVLYKRGTDEWVQTSV